MPMPNIVATETLTARILTIRGQRVMIDADLAELYGVPTKRLNEQLKRNRERFPADFMFQLSDEEKAEVVANCDHLSKLKFAKTLPFAFTEHGAIQAANVLNSDQAVAMGIYVVREFVRMRELIASHQDLAKRLADLEEKTEALALQQDTFAHNTRVQLKQVVEAIRQLTMLPEQPKRPIGFTANHQASTGEPGCAKGFAD
ncbi:MAG: ORF6N domain-containing protein [Rhodocyclaceae bacterium]|nr:ORF6N domain-containing protein [Rhodocyclaceae bacterium]